MGLLDSIIFLFAIVDAFGNLPIFIDLTSVMDPRTRQRAFDVTVLAGFAVVVLFSIAGRWVLSDVFRISVSEFQTAGGILLVAVGAHGMVAGEKPTPARGVGLEIAAVPMACPPSESILSSRGFGTCSGSGRHALNARGVNGYNVRREELSCRLIRGPTDSGGLL